MPSNNTSFSKTRKQLLSTFPMDCPSSFELIGMWFFPDAPEKKYLGILEYNPFEKKRFLTLYGIALDIETTVTCINGETTDGKRVSLFDSVVFKNDKKRDNEVSQHTVFKFLHFLKGNTYFFSKDTVSFQCLSFRLSSLAEWVGHLPFQPITQFKKKKGFFYEEKKPIDLYSDEHVCIQLQFLQDCMSSPFEIRMEYHPSILIKTKTKKAIPYWGDEYSLSFYKQVVDSFFSLVIGKNAFAYNVCGTTLKRCRRPSNVLLPSNRKTFLEINETLIVQGAKLEYEWFEPLPPGHDSLPYSFIQDHIKDFFTSFLHHFKSFDYILSDWMMIKNLSSFTNHALPTLLYNLEGLHKSFFPDYHKPLEDCCGKNQKNKTIPLRYRLRDIFFNQLNGYFPFITAEQMEVIIKDLVLLRTEDAHAKKRHHFSWSYQFNLILLVEFIIYFLILQRTYQKESNVLNPSALGWGNLQQELPGLVSERMKSLQQ